MRRSLRAALLAGLLAIVVPCAGAATGLAHDGAINSTAVALREREGFAPPLVGLDAADVVKGFLKGFVGEGAFQGFVGCTVANIAGIKISLAELAKLFLDPGLPWCWPLNALKIVIELTNLVLHITTAVTLCPALLTVELIVLLTKVAEIAIGVRTGNIWILDKLKTVIDENSAFLVVQVGWLTRSFQNDNSDNFGDALGKIVGRILDDFHIVSGKQLDPPSSGASHAPPRPSVDTSADRKPIEIAGGHNHEPPSLHTALHLEGANFTRLPEDAEKKVRELLHFLCAKMKEEEVEEASLPSPSVTSP